MKKISPNNLFTISTRKGHLLLASLALVFAMCSDSYGVVVIRDGFGDGDRNNDGIAFQENDGDNGIYGDILGDYEPHFDDDTSTVDGNPPIFPANTMVISPTIAGDTSNDTNNGKGIRWLSSGGWTGGLNDGDPTASPRVIDDSAGHMPETAGSSGFLNAISNETQFIPALDSGLALSVEGKGRGRGISGFFETDGDYSNGKQDTISLGPKVNDEVKVSFDFRLWMSAPNFCNEDCNNHVPNFGDLRFGLYQDTENQLGMTNNFAGQNFTAADWGLDDGAFRGDLAGPDATDDHGWFVRLPLADKDTLLFPSVHPEPGGASARIVEETNEDLADGGAKIHMQGRGINSSPQGDTQTVAQPDSDTPNFVNMETEKRYHIEFSLRRFDETGGSTNPADDGDNIEATVTVTDIDNPSDTFSFSGFDALDPTLEDPQAGFESDSWDYFAMTTGGQSVSDGLDWVLDNFVVEVIGSNEPMAGTDTEPDGDVDGQDFLALQRTNSALISDWQNDYPVVPLSASTAVPEPSAIVTICLGGLLALGTRRRIRE
ncbi:MAG: PEP-CTERM sorting domain-containing protein [Bythopirellula sp.]